MGADRYGNPEGADRRGNPEGPCRYGNPKGRRRCGNPRIGVVIVTRSVSEEYLGIL